MVKWHWTTSFMGTMTPIVTEEVTGNDIMSEILSDRNNESDDSVTPEDEVEHNSSDCENAITVTDTSNMSRPSSALCNDQEIHSELYTGQKLNSPKI